MPRVAMIDEHTSVLVWYRSGRELGRVRLDGGSVCVGRAADNELMVPADTVSNHHLRLKRHLDSWIAQDLGSSNGTEINGVALRGARPLVVGDRLMIGGEELLVRASGSWPRRSRCRMTRRAILFTCGVALALLTIPRPPQTGDAQAFEEASPSRPAPATVFAPAIESDRHGALTNQVSDGGAERADVLLRAAQQARWVGRIGEAWWLAQAARDMDPSSGAASLFFVRIDNERRDLVAHLQRDVALAEAARDDVAAAGYLNQLLAVLPAAAIEAQQAKATLARLTSSPLGRGDQP